MYRTSKLLWIDAAALALVLVGTLAHAAEVRKSFERTLAIDSPVELDVATGAGSITVQGAAVDRVTVHGDIRVRTDLRRNLAAAEALASRLESEPPIEQRGNRLRVGHLDAPEFSRNVVIDYVLEVPVTSTVKAASGSGDQRVAGIAGPLEVSTGSGDIALRDIGAAVAARAGSGDIEAEGIAGAFTAKTGSGDIDFRGAAAGDVDISTGSGRTTLRAVDGAARVHTGSGGIRLAGTPREVWELAAGSGGIRVDLPDDAAFELDAYTASGRLVANHPVVEEGLHERGRLHGTVRGGGPLLRARTGSGNIEID